VPADAAGIDTIRGITITPDAKAYVYGYIRTLSDLYLVEDLRADGIFLHLLEHCDSEAENVRGTDRNVR